MQDSKEKAIAETCQCFKYIPYPFHFLNYNNNYMFLGNPALCAVAQMMTGGHRERCNERGTWLPFLK